MLFNLIGNALKFTFQGSVSIRLSFEQNDVLKTEVIDTGLGITSEETNKLFKFFGKLHSTHRINQGGMGLGLSISKMIVEQLGGKIDVSSEPGQGSDFSFTIKRNTEISEEEAKEEAKEEVIILRTEEAQLSDSENDDLNYNPVETIM